MRPQTPSLAMDTVRFVGVDPGVSGGIAVLTVRADDPSVLVSAAAYPFPSSQRMTLALVQDVVGDPSTCMAAFEKNHGYVGGAGDPGVSMFRFGESSGEVRMALVACGLEPTDVPPQTWQRTVNVKRIKKEKRGPWKNRLKQLAAAMFPLLVVTLKTADALLIAEHLRRSSTMP